MSPDADETEDVLVTEGMFLSLPPVPLPSPTVPPQIEGDSLTSLTFKGHGEKVRVNGTLTLSCLAKGFPEPKVNWFKDGQVLGTDARTGQTRDEQIRGTVQVEGKGGGGGGGRTEGETEGHDQSQTWLLESSRHRSTVVSSVLSC